ncbi:hypothetical protein [Streptomyces sp. NPDC058758]|uniref:hypothetical protein n=1 Tax=unclassified Streptomyces TaxID=2593676 RepID=UPI0036BC84BF
MAPYTEAEAEEQVLLREYVPAAREPLADPRITRLAALVHELLGAYEEATGRPPQTADQIRAALAAVAEIPEEARRRASAGRAAAAHAAHQRRRHR